MCNNRNCKEWSWRIVIVKIGLIFHDMGITSRYTGYKYLIDAVLLGYENEEKLTHITKDVYPELAKKYHASVWMIETDIRKVIEQCWKKTDPQRIEKYFAQKAYEKRPTNTEFISQIVYYLKTNE